MLFPFEMRIGKAEKYFLKLTLSYVSVEGLHGIGEYYCRVSAQSIVAVDSKGIDLLSSKVNYF